jgi:outer membrane protein assembly factor BamE (lipoprotein component of BamABCDE complex)
MLKRIACLGLVLFLGLVCLSACASRSVGSAKLNEDVVKKITPEQTTKEEVLEMLGRPYQMNTLPKAHLSAYLYQLTMEKPDMKDFPEEQYEVWTYWKSTAKRYAPGVSSRSDEKCVLVFDQNGVCVKEYYFSGDDV